MKTYNSSNTNLKILAIIITSGFLLRFLRFEKLFYYTMDEEVMNLIQRRIVLGEHYPLIGSVSPLSTYLGPIFYYIGAIILAISKLNPLGQGFFAILLGTFNIFFIYRVAKGLFNEKVGILSSCFYSSSFLMVLFDRRYWHLSLGPLLSMIILFSIFKIKIGSTKFIYPLVFALILGWNTDYTNLVLFLFVGLSWLLFKLPIKKREIGIALIIFILSNIPLLLFDLRHDFLNTTAFINYFTKVKTSSNLGDRESLGETRFEQTLLSASLPFITFSRSLYINSDLNISKQHTYCKEFIIQRNTQQGVVPPFLAFIIFISFMVITIKKSKSENALAYKLVFSFFIIFLFGVFIYAAFFRGDVFEHYLATLLPFIFILSAVVVSEIFSKNKIFALVLVLIFLTANFNSWLHSYNPLGFKNKLEATKFALDKVGSHKFSLDSLGSCFKFDGFYYPFLLFGRHPEKSYQDPNYSWLYDYTTPKSHPDRIVVMVSKGEFEKKDFFENYNRYNQWVIEKKSFGGIEVLILDNSKGEFH